MVKLAFFQEVKIMASVKDYNNRIVGTSNYVLMTVILSSFG